MVGRRRPKFCTKHAAMAFVVMFQTLTLLTNKVRGGSRRVGECTWGETLEASRGEWAQWPLATLLAGLVLRAVPRHDWAKRKTAVIFARKARPRGQTRSKSRVFLSEKRG